MLFEKEILLYVKILKDLDIYAVKNFNRVDEELKIGDEYDFGVIIDIQEPIFESQEYVDTYYPSCRFKTIIIKTYDVINKIDITYIDYIFYRISKKKEVEYED